MSHSSDGPASVAEPLFTTTGSTTTASLFDLFARITAGESFELTRMAAHQRVPVVTTLALLMTVLRRHAPSPPVSANDWHAAWLEQIGPEALRLVAPDTEVAFLQPPLDPGGRRSALSLSDIDLVFAKLAHAVKPVEVGSAEDAVLALMGGTWKSSALKWVAGSRYGLAAVLASDDGSLAGEVRHLLAAYEACPSDLIGRQAQASRAADHLLWLRPVSQSGLPIVTARMVRTAHERGMAVHVWTIDDPAEMERLLDLGVDGIMTDRPAVLKDVLTRRGLWH